MCAALLVQTIPFIFNSDPASGAENVSPDGSSFQVSLNEPILVPKGAVDCRAGVLQSSIWNTAFNISTSFGNNRLRFTTTTAPIGTYTFTVPNGLYSIEGLNSYLSSQFVNLTLPPNLITISGDSATQKSIVTFLTSGNSIDFTVANSIREILGFNSVVITAPSANFSFFSDSFASFNRVNSFIIQSNLVSEGIPVNNQSRGIIGSVPIDKPPGSQITYSPQNVIWFNARDLIGKRKINMTFSLLDQNLRPVATPENWSLTLKIEDTILLLIKR